MRKLLFLCSIFVFITGCDSTENTESPSEQSDTIIWQPFNSKAFEVAQKEDKLLFLEVGANWCHWCHVMDEKTYSDQKVQQYLNNNFVLTREDQDSRPDLFAAYRKWGWPAIIIFNANGDELLHLKGYQPKKGFLVDLKSIRENPIATTKNNKETAQTEERKLSSEIAKRFKQQIDTQKGGYKGAHRYLSLPGIIYGIQHSNDPDLENWLKTTIESSYLLNDPVWGGVYQYSTHKSWDHQHYEKLLRVQAFYAEAYARYGAVYNDSTAINYAKSIITYCQDFLGNDSPLFYNSQNADVINGEHSVDYFKSSDSERRAQGIPSVDEHLYLKENALMAKAILYLWSATGDEALLVKAEQMTNYLLQNYRIKETNLFAREVNETELISLEDNRAMLDLLMTMNQITGKTKYLNYATETGLSIIQSFDQKDGLAAVSGNLTIPASIVVLDNLNAVRSFYLLGHLSNETDFINYSKQLFEKLDLSKHQNYTAFQPLIISNTELLNEEPYHAVCIINPADKNKAQQYIQHSLSRSKQPFIFERAIIGNFTEEQEMLYSGMESGTVFLCTSSFCSAPIYSVQALSESLTAL